MRRLETNIQQTSESVQHLRTPNVIRRTCHETRAANASLISGMYWIDPDGQGVGDDPIQVYCNMTTGNFWHIIFCKS